MQSAEATVRAEERKRKEKNRNSQIKSCFCRSQFFIFQLACWCHHLTLQANHFSIWVQSWCIVLLSL